MGFNPNDFMKKLADFVRQHPRFASRAYATAARKMSEAAAHDPKNRFGYQMIANRLEEFAAQAQLPPVDWESGEMHALFADTPPGASVATEWDAMVADMEASKIGPDGNFNSELVSAFLADRLHAKTLQASEIAPDGTPAGMPTEVNVTPSSAEAGKTLFGSSALVQFGPNPSSSGSSASNFTGTGSPVPVQEGMVCRWDGDENETVMCTIAVSRVGAGAGATYPGVIPPAGGQNTTYRPFFRVQFGNSRAAPINVVGDVGVGVQFSVATSFLYVSVGMDPPPSVLIGGLPNVSGSMYLSGTFGFFGAGRSTKVNRTVYIDQLANGGTQTFNIPAFATEIITVLTTQASYKITFLDPSGVQLGTVSYNAGAQNTPVPIPDDASQVQIQNTGAATAEMRVIFGLSL